VNGAAHSIAEPIAAEANCLPWKAQSPPSPNSCVQLLPPPLLLMLLLRLMLLLLLLPVKFLLPLPDTSSFCAAPMLLRIQRARLRGAIRTRSHLLLRSQGTSLRLRNRRRQTWRRAQ